MESNIGRTKESPIMTAMGQLKNSIGRVEETMTKFESILSSVLTNPEASPTTAEKRTEVAQTELESSLREMTDRVLAINEYLGEVQNRVQL